MLFQSLVFSIECGLINGVATKCSVGGCSQWGWCGTGAAYQSGLCQSQYSAPNGCNPIVTSIPSGSTISTDGLCGLTNSKKYCPDQQCCSQWGTFHLFRLLRYYCTILWNCLSNWIW
eukprot:NODE_558_length_6080_cov_0.296773.p7 type:complete len:117 gc:universal NODE_558_length_6080_cov_0.296773:469-819(+)